MQYNPASALLIRADALCFFRIVKDRNSVLTRSQTATHALDALSFDFKGPGGGERDRTDDLLLAKQALSQLSYTPEVIRWWVWLDSNQRPPPYQDGALTD